MICLALQIGTRGDYGELKLTEIDTSDFRGFWRKVPNSLARRISPVASRFPLDNKIDKGRGGYSPSRESPLDLNL